MKKILAALLALTITCAVAAGCSDSSSGSDAAASSAASSSQSDSTADGSSNQDTSESQAETTTTTAETTTTTSQTTAATTLTEETTTRSPEEQAAFEKSYTSNMQNALKAKNFGMELTITYPMGNISIPIKFRVSGSNSYMSMDMSSFGGEAVPTETYVIDGKSYSLNPATKSYTVMENSASSDQGFSFVVDSVLPENFRFVKAEEKDGLVAETIMIKSQTAMGSSSENETVLYYDKNTKLLKKAEASSNGMKTVAEISKFEIGNQKIQLPDLTGWKQTQGSSAAQMQMTPGSIQNPGGQS